MKNLEFVPAMRLAYNPSDASAVAVETYSDFGRFKGFPPVKEQAHQLYGVVNHVAGNGLEWEFGVGVGLTDASDRLTLKMILAKDLNKK